ncbi:MAG: Fic family protein [Acidithiobacillus sp.]
MTESVGYEFLRDRWQLPVFPMIRPTMVAPVTRVTAQADRLLVPSGVAPGTDSPLDHVLFALKHEGTNLQVLSEIMPHIAAEDIGQAVWAKPNSGYVRITAYLWEHFTGMRLVDIPPITASTIPVFDADRYLVSADPQKDARWRVAFNGLGDLDYCVTVQRTEAIESLLDENVLEQTRRFFEQTEKPVMDRAIAWAYLSETEGSFAIERETVPENKAEAFASLLRKAFDPEVCNEAYLSHLQNAVITNPLDRAACYRGTQNWLHNGLRGASGIAYLPPPPELLENMMPHIANMADTLHRQVDPIVAAGIVSFAFVYAHPFMDGNGRLSRFLFHRTLAQSGQMETPATGKMLLPVSVAMKRHESEYLRALQSFSTPARNLWDVRWIDQEQFDFKLNGGGAPYRYWDATDAVRFGLQMAKEALREDLQAEVNTLVQYDAIYRQVDAVHDVRNQDLSVLIRSCMENAGSVSKNRRKQYAVTVPEKVFDAIEDAWTSFMVDCDSVTADSPEDALPNEEAAEADRVEQGAGDERGRRDV